MKKETIRQRKIAEFVNQFLYVNRLHRIQVEEQISRHGIHSSQHHMLVLISQSKSICQKDIAEKLNISSAAVAVTLNKLESADLIARTPSFDDARMNHITVTDKGAQLLKNTKAMLAEADEEFFKNVTDEEIEAVSSVLKKITDAAEEKAAAAKRK